MERDEAVGIAIGQRISHNKLFVSKLRRKATGIEGEGEGFRELQFGAHHPIIIMNGVMEWATEELVTGMGLRIVVARAVYQFVIQHDVSHGLSLVGELHTLEGTRVGAVAIDVGPAHRAG